MPTYYFGEGLSGPTFKDPNSTFGAGGHQYSNLDAGLQDVPLVYQCLENSFSTVTSTTDSITYGGATDAALYSNIDPAEFGATDLQFKYQLTAGADGAIVNINSVEFYFTYEFDVSGATAPTDPFLSSSSLTGAAIGGGYVVAVGANSAIYYSTDYGQNWLQATSPIESNFRDVIWDGSKFYACGSGGILIESADAQTWTLNRNDRTTDYIDLAKVRGGDISVLAFDETMLTKDKLESSFEFMNRTQL